MKTPKLMQTVVAACLVVGALSGCATTANNPKDPYEGFNRAMFAVNEKIDVVVKPVAQGYDAVAPLPVRAGVGARLGINLGYLKFTEQPTWNPF